MKRNKAYISLGDPNLSDRIAKALSGFSSLCESWIFEAKGFDPSLILPELFWVVELDCLPKNPEAESRGCPAGFVAICGPDNTDGDLILSRFSPSLRILPNSARFEPWEIGAALRDLALAKAGQPGKTGGAGPTWSFRNLIAALPDIIYVLDGDGRFVFLNSSVENLGYSPKDLIGRHFAEIIHPEERDLVSRETVVTRIRLGGSLPADPPKLFDERRSGERMTRNLQVRLMRGDGCGPMYGSVNAYGVPITDSALLELFDCDGPVTVGVIHDITTSILYQRSLEENLVSKALLLRELHQRVRNNLQVVASLVRLKEQGLEDGARASLECISAQIRSIAMVHEALYSTENLRDVGVVEYFERLAGLLSETYGKVGSPVSFKVKGDRALRLDADSLSYLALIASGFAAIAFGQALPSGTGGLIEIGFTAGPAGTELVLIEDGSDCLERYKAEPDFEIAEGLAAQLGGTLSLVGGRGTTVRVCLPPPAL
ncbi:MAG: PAS domain S-box protein [Spirochaetes bacterium]|nr:PAS domain S-box protein [Spirochaetota bacterium]